MAETEVQIGTPDAPIGLQKKIRQIGLILDLCLFAKRRSMFKILDTWKPRPLELPEHALLKGEV